LQTYSLIGSNVWGVIFQPFEKKKCNKHIKKKEKEFGKEISNNNKKAHQRYPSANIKSI
jgi:hypothetical protein